MNRVFTEKNVVVCFGAFLKMTEGKTGKFVGCVNTEECEKEIAEAVVASKARPDFVQTWYDEKKEEHMNAFVFEAEDKRDKFLEALKLRAITIVDDDTAKEVAQKTQEQWDKEEVERAAYRVKWFQDHAEAASKVAVVKGTANGTGMLASESAFLEGFVKFSDVKPVYTAMLGADGEGGFWCGYFFKNETFKKSFVNKLGRMNKKPAALHAVMEGELWQELVIRLVTEDEAHKSDMKMKGNIE